MKAIVTGGAGFIGSHLVDKLMEMGWNVKVIDNLSQGRIEYLEKWMDNPRFSFVKMDLKEHDEVLEEVKDCDVVFHLAAYPEVRAGIERPDHVYKENVEITFNILEAIRMNGIPHLVFTSSSTVYGDAKVMPTPEDYSPMEPISIYGASKLACEALIMGYSHTFKFKSLILRLANIVGPRLTHGVIYDFINKLKKDPRKLEILGDGTQRKSYLHVYDCVKAILHLYEVHKRKRELIEIYNVGSMDWITVREIAEIVVRTMGLREVEFYFTGGVEGGRGWIGDVKYMLLDISKAMREGWKPSMNSREAVEATAREMVRELL
ncbi:MAG: UDP-glucose 4-epimerase [Thermoprotei archaeon]|nr:MAG: UDP-glucose 4-epimerase [Thermoprotei archaeon]RLF25627.1 MAG: UDP-glucose 4-epimerase [Thermoprotei archaeon]